LVGLVSGVRMMHLSIQRGAAPRYTGMTLDESCCLSAETVRNFTLA
jgi:hypothetical protein